jgi:hypothetical protein
VNLEKKSNKPLGLDKGAKRGGNLNLDKGGAVQPKLDLSKSGNQSASTLDLNKKPPSAPKLDLGKSAPAAQTLNSGKSGKSAASVTGKTGSSNVTGDRASARQAVADDRSPVPGTSAASSVAASAKRSGGAKKKSRVSIYVKLGVLAAVAAAIALVKLLPDKNEVDYAEQSDGSYEITDGGYEFTSAGTIDAGDKQVAAPAGTVVSESGVATIPEGRIATYSAENNVIIEIPSGSVVTKEGDISVPSSGEVTLDCSLANMSEDGSIGISIPAFIKDNASAPVVVVGVNENGTVAPVKAAMGSAETSIVITNGKPQKYIVKLGNGDYTVKGGESAEVSFFADAGILNDLIVGKELDISQTFGRDEAVAMILQAFGISPNASFSVAQFDDVNGEYSDYIRTARELGLVEGIGGDSFAPSKTVKYEDLYKVIANCIDNKRVKLPPNVGERSSAIFDDYAEIPVWAQSAIDELISAGAISRSDGKLGIGEDVSINALCQQLYLFVE